MKKGKREGEEEKREKRERYNKNKERKKEKRRKVKKRRKITMPVDYSFNISTSSPLRWMNRDISYQLCLKYLTLDK